MTYTSNFCRNPSFQMGITGYSALLTGQIALDTTNVLYGNQSLFVNCPGNKPGEGCATAGGVIPNRATCSASIYLTGNGAVVVYALIAGTVVGSQPVTLTGQWQRVVLNGISSTPGQTILIEIATATATQCQFWVSGCQIEDSSPAHPYCDGDQSGCEWTEGFWGGVSVCYFENPVTAVSNVTTTPDVVNILNTGERYFVTPVPAGSDNFNPLVILGGAGPAAALSDFSVSSLTDPDPAQTYTSWNNATIASATGSSYNRSWSVFYPPVDYLVSGGEYLYSRAAYFAAGWYFTSVPSDGTVNITRVQAEVLPVTTGYGQPSPSSFDPPRAIHSIIKPDRLNFCPNPSIEVSTAGWSATGSAAISQDGTVSVGDIIEYDDNLLTAGTHSLKVTCNANGDGAEITLVNLITGLTYIVSAYVQPGQGFDNIVLAIADGDTSVLATGGTGYGAGGYGEGYYGGIDPMNDLPENVWYRINCIFTATADSHVLQIQSSAAVDVSYPANMWIDAVLAEAGEDLSFYFDGSFGINYSWETGGTAGLTRSYYYDQSAVKQQAVLNILDRHTPLGIEAGTPQYSTPYIQ